MPARWSALTIPLNSRTCSPRRPGRRVERVRGEVADRAVAPVVRQAALGEEVLVGDVVDRQQLDRRHAERAEVLDRRFRRQARIGAAQVVANGRMQLREALDVGLVDDGVVPGRARRRVALPVEARVDDDALRDRGGVVLVVDARGRRRRRRRARREAVAASQSIGPSIAFAYGSIRSLLGLNRWPCRRAVAAVDAVAVPLARADAREVACQLNAVRCVSAEPRLVVVVVEQAELDVVGVLGEEREVRALAVPGRRRAGRAGPARRSRVQLHRPRVRSRRRASRARAACSASVRVASRLHLAREGTSQREQPAVVVAKPGLARARASNTERSPRPEDRARPRRRRPSRRRTPACGPPACLGDRRVDVVGEELERVRLPVLLAHEEERRLRGEEDDRRGDAERVGRETVAEGAVADLVVVLRADDVPLGRPAPELARRHRQASRRVRSTPRARRSGGRAAHGGAPSAQRASWCQASSGWSSSTLVSAITSACGAAACTRPASSARRVAMKVADRANGVEP